MGNSQEGEVVRQAGRHSIGYPVCPSCSCTKRKAEAVELSSVGGEWNRAVRGADTKTSGMRSSRQGKGQEWRDDATPHPI